MGAFFESLWKNWLTFIDKIPWISDGLDILLVALFVYFVIRLVRDSRAEQFVRTILLLAVLYLFAYVMQLTTVLFMLKAVFNSGLLVLAVVFQPEIRRALEQAGHSGNGLSRVWMGLGSVDNAAVIDQWNKAINATVAALKELQKQKMGALIVMERATRLGEIVRSGTIMEADPSAALIASVFYNKAPLHDGAMIIRDGRVYAAACILPLTDNLQISRELGTRHRAGVGMSENSDAVVIILSEETGVISLAEGGELTRNHKIEDLANELAKRMLWDQDNTTAKRKFRLRKKKGEETK